MNRLSKVLLSLAAIQYGVIPPLVDLSESHVFHTAWPPHAKFHMVWLLCVGTGMATYVIALVWGPTKNRKQAFKHASVLGCVILTGFFLAFFASNAYGGSLSDPEHQVLVMGIDGNLVSFSVAAALQAFGTFLAWKEPSYA